MSICHKFHILDNKLLQLKGRIIHQVWFGTIPNQYKADKQYKKLQKYRDSWIEKNLTWHYVEWDKEMSDTLVKNYYPEYYDLYKTFPYEIQRCDMVRYCFLHRYGGLYADMDYYCNKPIDEALNGKYTNNFYLTQTPNMPGEFVSNSLMYSTPRHIFWIKLLIAMENCHFSHMFYSNYVVIMYTTGPGIINKIYHRYKIKYKLKSLPWKYFNPYSMSCDILRLKNSRAYTIHMGTSSWHTADGSIILTFLRDYPIFLFILFAIIGINFIYYFSSKDKCLQTKTTT